LKEDIMQGVITDAASCTVRIQLEAFWSPLIWRMNLRQRVDENSSIVPD
jgi:hypothetical protein